MLRFVRLFLIVNFLVVGSLIFSGCAPKDNSFTAEGKAKSQSFTIAGQRPTSSCKSSWKSIRVSNDYYNEGTAKSATALFALGNYSCNEVGSSVGYQLGKFIGDDFDFKNATQLGQRKIVRIDFIQLLSINDEHVKMSALTSKAALLNMIQATASSKTRDRGMVTVIYIEGSTGVVGKPTSFTKVGQRPTSSCKSSWKSVRASSDHYDAAAANSARALFSLGDYSCNEIGSTVGYQLGKFSGDDFDFKGAKQVGSRKITRIDFIQVTSINEEHVKLSALGSKAKLLKMIQDTASSKTRNRGMLTVIYIEGATAQAPTEKTVTKKGQGVSQCKKEWGTLQLSSDVYSATSAGHIKAAFYLGDYSCHLVGSKKPLSLGKYNSGTFDYKNAADVGEKTISKIQTLMLSKVDKTHAQLAGISLAKLRKMISDTASPKVRNKNIVTIIYFDSAAPVAFQSLIYQKDGEMPATCKSTRAWKVLSVSADHYTQATADTIGAAFNAGKMNCHRIGDVIQIRRSQYVDGKAQRSGFKLLKFKGKITKIEIIKVASLAADHAKSANMTLVTLKKMIGETALGFVDKSIVAIVHFDQIR